MYNNLSHMTNIVEKAKRYAIDAHRAVQHKYDEHEYEHHLEMADTSALKFIYLIPVEDRDNVRGGVWSHDSIEDCGLTFSDLKKETNEIVAELAYACTNEKGRTRAERANDKYYEGIINTKYATFVKLCDRIANIEYSLSKKSRMFDMYKKEHSHFKTMLHTTSEYDDMWNYIDELLTKK